MKSASAKPPVAKPTITAFKDSPDEGRGLARDMRVRWAFEEINLAYDVKLVTFDEMETPAYLALQPFGQIPAYSEGDLVMFESGAIILHLAEKHTGLIPSEEKSRMQALSWMFAALNTVEPPIIDLEVADLLEQDQPWYAARLPFLKDRIREVIAEVARKLGSSKWLNSEFNASDILMMTVLRRAEGTGLLEEFPTLLAYIARCEQRPAYQRAFAAQLEVFERSR